MKQGHRKKLNQTILHPPKKIKYKNSVHKFNKEFFCMRGALFRFSKSYQKIRFFLLLLLFNTTQSQVVEIHNYRLKITTCVYDSFCDKYIYKPQTKNSE